MTLFNHRDIFVSGLRFVLFTVGDASVCQLDCFLFLVSSLFCFRLEMLPFVSMTVFFCYEYAELRSCGVA